MTNHNQRLDEILEHIVLATDNGQPYIKSTDTAVEAIKALISDQVAKARIDERDNAWKSFYKAYDNGDKAGDYIIKGVMKKVHANNRKFRVECYWCGGVMYRYSNKFKVKHIMCSCWRDEEKRADRIATPKRSKQ